MSLRWRWALTLALVAALAIGLTAWAATLSADRQLRGAVDANLRERAAHVSRGEIPDSHSGPEVRRNLGGDVPQPEERPSVLDDLPRAAGRSRIVDLDAVLQVFDREGGVVLRIGPDQVNLPIETVDLGVATGAGRSVIRDVRIGGVAYRMITARLWDPARDNASGTAFQIATDVSRVNANLAGFTRRMVPIGVIGILLVGLTGWILASRAVRPVSDLAEAAEQIAATERLDTETRLNRSAPGEIGRLATAFSAMLSALATSRKQQQRLVSDAGHEFRTPITALKTNLETLLRQNQNLTDEQRRRMLEAALAESNQLAGLATELVDLSTDVHQNNEDYDDIETDELASDIAHRFRRIGGKKVVITGKGASVKGRRSQLERALGNLVDNAVKWATERVEIHLDGGRVRVTDDGPGISEEDLPHIFNRFYRSRDVRSTPGSGLGLAIVQHLVVAHGGTVFARNGASGGAQVGFELPVERVKEPPDRSE